MSLFHTVRRRSARLVAVTAAMLLVATLAAPASAHDDAARASAQQGQALGRSAPGLGAELARVRAATARYHDVEMALADGYAPASTCVEDAGGAGAMGYHYVNLGLVGQLDPAQPQALLYHPAPNGRLRLVAVEYLSPVGGELFGSVSRTPAHSDPRPRSTSGCGRPTPPTCSRRTTRTSATRRHEVTGR